MKRVLCMLALASASAAAMAQSSTPMSLGVSAGWYFPTSKTLTDVFGDQIFTVGLSPFAGALPNSGQLIPGVNVIGADSNGSNFLLVPVTIGYMFHGDNTDASIVPYARIDGGAAYYNFNLSEPGGNNSGSAFGWVADAEVGAMLSKTLTVSAKYYLFEQQSGINFNGFEIGITIGLIRL